MRGESYASGGISTTGLPLKPPASEPFVRAWMTTKVLFALT